MLGPVSYTSEDKHACGDPQGFGEERGMAFMAKKNVSDVCGGITELHLGLIGLQLSAQLQENTLVYHSANRIMLSMRSICKPFEGASSQHT